MHRLALHASHAERVVTSILMRCLAQRMGARLPDCNYAPLFFVVVAGARFGPSGRTDVLNQALPLEKNYFAAILVGFSLRSLIEFGRLLCAGFALSLGCVHGPTLMFVGLKVIRFPRPTIGIRVWA
jgi:hypothetical protein